MFTICDSCYKKWKIAEQGKILKKAAQCQMPGCSNSALMQISMKPIFTLDPMSAAIASDAGERLLIASESVKTQSFDKDVEKYITELQGEIIQATTRGEYRAEIVVPMNRFEHPIVQELRKKFIDWFPIFVPRAGEGGIFGVSWRRPGKQ